MKFITTSIKMTQLKTDIQGILLFSDDVLKQVLNFLPGSLKTACLKLSQQARFRAKKSQILTVATHGQLPAFLIILVGLGKARQSANLIVENLREACALAAQTAKKYQAEKLGIILPDKTTKQVDSQNLGVACAEGLILGTYKFEKYKKPKKKPEREIKEVVFGTTDQRFKKGLQLGAVIAKGVNLARDLINEPSGHLTPDELLNTAKQVARQSTQVSLTSIPEKDLQRKGFGGLAAVSQGSGRDAQLIHLRYQPRRRSRARVALIGKGITFDSGGLSIKPGEFMENMKIDMAGGAAVLGIFQILTTLQPPVEVHGIIPACENLSGERALKPGDVIKIKGGKTVEVVNTDAEGRLILADALSYALEQKVNQVIDIATLTGACIVALGNDIAGILGNNQELIDKIIAAGQVAGEKIWQLPLEQKYQETLKSDLADLRNVSKMKGGGTITAGLFLKQFVGETPWVHLDIAGPAWAEKPFSAYLLKGAVGFGVRTVVEYLLEKK